jgi:uncharacterized small protein (DUF1192 family)
MTETLNAEPAGGTFDQLLEALESPSRVGDGNGRGNSGGNGPGGGDDGHDFGPLKRFLIDAFERSAEMQSELTLKATEMVIARVVGLVAEAAAQAVRNDEIVAKTLSEAVAKSIGQNADLAEHVVKLGERVVTLEAEVARLKAQHAAPESERTLQ